MRPSSHSIGALWLVLSALTIALAGCSTGSQENLSSSASLSPRPDEGMRRDAPRAYPDGSTPGNTYNGGGTNGRPYAEAPRRYVDPGQPTPREYASYNSGHGPDASQNIQTGSLGTNPAANPNNRWQQPERSNWPQQQPKRVTTGSVGSERFSPNVVEVREGDTLYSLSRRHNVPVGDIVAANRLTSERIAIGQRLVIPTRYR